MNALNFYRKIKKYAHNSFWIMGEKFVNLFATFLVSILLARYLGPDQYGMLAYALSITAIFAAAGHMGLAGLVVRELVRKPDESNITLGSTWMLKMIGMFIAYIMIAIYAKLFEVDDNYTILMIVSLVVFFQPFDVVDYWFQSKVQSRYSSIVRIFGIISAAALRVGAVMLGAGILWFAYIQVFQFFLIAVGFVIAFNFRSSSSITKWRFERDRALRLLGQGSLIYLGSIFSIIYVKSDQVMLRWLVDDKAVGIYSVAAQLSEAWYFVPIAIVASLFPKLIEVKDKNEVAYENQLQHIYDLLCWLAILVATLVSIFSGSLIALLYGPAYEETALILSIHIWAGVFIFMRALFSRWIIIENLLWFSMWTQGMGAVVNIVLNLIFIPKYGGQGAAITTLISYAVASYFSLLLSSKTRGAFYMMSKSFFFPVRYMIARVKNK